jgi:hypothetical protein
MKQTEKLASAVYLLKKANNRPTDEQVWAGKDEAMRHLMRTKGEGLFSIGETLGNLPSIAIPVLGLTAAGTLGGNVLGRGLGRGFAPQLERLLSKFMMNNTERAVHYAGKKYNKVFNPEAHARDIKRTLALGSEAGGVAGILGGGITGLLTGGSIGESIMKPKIIDKLREKGYPL